MPTAYSSTVLDAPVERVWEKLRDFNGLAGWHPAVADSMIEDGKPADQLGCVRVLTLKDGAEIVERLVAQSDEERSYSYAILSGPFPVTNYRSTLRAKPVTDTGQTFVEWFSSFDCEAGQADQARGIFEGAVYKGGLDALKVHFGG
ncbi:SRPBCC family protein [Geminicoccaceae bacterium 1502E]|nr:SRPBCC family protein [Geminicoccaceae bacterium 1502E]